VSRSERVSVTVTATTVTATVTTATTNTTTPAWRIKRFEGAVDLSVDSVSGFISAHSRNDNAAAGVNQSDSGVRLLREAIAAPLSGVSSDDVQILAVRERVPDRRLRGRRLAAGTVSVEYRIDVAATTAGRAAARAGGRGRAAPWQVSLATAAMGHITPEIPGKLPGYLSPSAGLKFANVPHGLAAPSKVPAAGWGQIHAYVAFREAPQDQSPGTATAAKLAEAMMAIIGTLSRDGLFGSA
jgi:hypothetical protein